MPSPVDFKGFSYAFNATQCATSIIDNPNIRVQMVNVWEMGEIRTKIQQNWESFPRHENLKTVQLMQTQPIIEVAALLEHDSRMGTNAKFNGLSEEEKRLSLYGSAANMESFHEKNIVETLLRDVNKPDGIKESTLSSVVSNLIDTDPIPLFDTAREYYDKTIKQITNPTPVNRMGILESLEPSLLAGLYGVGYPAAFDGLSPNQLLSVMYESLRHAKDTLQTNDMPQAILSNSPDRFSLQQRINQYTSHMDTIGEKCLYQYDLDQRNLFALHKIQKDIIMQHAAPPAVAAAS